MQVVRERECMMFEIVSCLIERTDVVDDVNERAGDGVLDRQELCVEHQSMASLKMRGSMAASPDDLVDRSVQETVERRRRPGRPILPGREANSVG